MKTAQRVERAEPGLHLVIGAGDRVLRSAEIRNAPRRFLQPPFVVASRLDEVPDDISELVLDVLSRDGRVLDSFGWPWTSEAFYDRPLRDVVRGLLAYEGIRVGRIQSSQPLRVLRVPVARSASFLLFSLSRVTPRVESQPRAITRTGLALYSRVTPIPPAPRLPIPDAHLSPELLPGSVPLDRPR